MDQRLGNYLIETSTPIYSSSLADLPSELLIQIFSYLDPFTLDNTIGNVCQNWRYIINNNELWKETFKKRFGTIQFASLSRNKIWRNEYILRDQILKKWSKGSSIHRNYFIQNLVLTDLKTDFPNDKLVVFSTQNGMVNVANLTNGKNLATIPVLSPSETTVYKMTKNCIVFGRYDGKIYGKLLSSKSYLSDIIQFEGGTHHDSVTAIDCVENISGKDDIVGCISGDSKGVLKLWDLKNTTLLESIQICENGILNIDSNYKDLIIVQDSQNNIIIIHKNLTDPKAPTYKIQTMETEPTVFDKMCIDYGMQQIIMTCKKKISIYSFDLGSFGTLKSYTCLHDEICEIAIDNNRNRDIDHKIVGNDGCMLATALKSGLVLVFNIRLNTLSPITTIQPFFKNEVPLNFNPIRSIAVNPLVVLIGTYNGYCYLFNILTGAYIRTASIRIPRRLLPIEYNIPVECISLNQDNYITNGVIVCGNVVQYFQFGDLSTIEQKKKKKIKGLSDRKFAIKRGIKTELDDMSYELELADRTNKLMSKYNGTQFDEEEELQMALLLSQSMDNNAQNSDEDKELAKILELSKNESTNNSQQPGLDEGSSSRYDQADPELAKILELSKQETQLSTLNDDNFEFEEDEDDISKAIRLSLQHH